jgi:zinc transport system substrate-binding protein
MKVHRFPALAASALALVLASSGCSDSGASGKPQVVASFYPLQFVAEEVAGDHAEVTNLTAPGVEPHDLELSPRQTARLSGADVVVYEKGLQPAVDEAVANDAPDHVVDAAEAVELHQSDEHAGEGEEHGHDDADPHFWLDPTLLAEVADTFTEAVAEADPANAADYRRANDELQAQLRALDEEFRAGLADCRTRTIVVSHDAFGYLGRRYDLDVHPIAGLSPGAEPSPRHLAELAELIRTEEITTVFSERLASPKFADTLARDLDITTAVLDPLEGLASSDTEADYLSLMRENLAALRKAGGCS